MIEEIKKRAEEANEELAKYYINSDSNVGVTLIKDINWLIKEVADLEKIGVQKDYEIKNALKIISKLKEAGKRAKDSLDSLLSYNYQPLTYLDNPSENPQGNHALVSMEMHEIIRQARLKRTTHE